MLEKTGFIDIKMEDYTKDYCRIVNEQLANAKVKLHLIKLIFISENCLQFQMVAVMECDISHVGLLF